MIKKSVPLSNDAVDKHGDRMTLKALKNAKLQTNSKVIISHNEHDFTTPPIGRMEKAYIRNIDGVNWLLGDFRLFGIDDVNKENKLKNRELAIHSQDIASISVACDRSYQINDLVSDVELVQKAFDKNSAIRYENKKSLEPISTLTFVIGMGATFAVSSFFKGFFGEAGKGAWNELKKLIDKNAKINPSEEKQYQFVFVFQNDFYKVEVMVIFTNPVPDEIEEIIKKSQDKIDGLIIKYYTETIRAGRIVFTCNDMKLQHAYSVYKCGTPFDLSDMEAYELILEKKTTA